MKKKLYLPIVISAILSFATLSVYLKTASVVKEEPQVQEIDKVLISKAPAVCNHEHVLHHERLEPTLKQPGHIEFYFCCDCFKSFHDEACTEEIENSNLGLDNKEDGRYLSPITGSFSLLPQNIKNYLDAEEDKDIINALRNKSSYNDQLKRTIAWAKNGNGPYTVEISTDRKFESFHSFVTTKNLFTFEGTFVPGETYYYRVKDAGNAYILDDLSFKIDDSYSVRLIKVDGVSNMRDIGGWTAKNGKKIPYGKLYRGGSLASITSIGKETFLNETKLGIKTEIDLRAGDEGVSSLVDPRLNYQKLPIWNYTRIIPDYYVYSDDNIPLGYDDVYSAVGIKAIFELLANPNNYPAYFHCAAGADRTGTLAYLINGLLGVSYEDLTKDFELTTFSIYGDRYRSDVDEDTMTFTDKGSFKNLTAIWGKLNEVMMGRYGNYGEKPLYKAIENYLKTVCNVSDETIAKVRLNILGEEVDFND